MWGIGTLSQTRDLVRKLLEAATGWELPPRQPWWLRLPESKQPLTLDGYNVEHRLAFDQQRLGDSPRSLLEQRWIEAFKRWKCAEMHVTLITVTNDDTSRLGDVLRAQLDEARKRRHWTDSAWNDYLSMLENEYQLAKRVYQQFMTDSAT